MHQAIRTIGALLLATAVLYAGNGLQTTLLSVRANLEGFALVQIGLLLSGYFVGFIAGCHFSPRLVKRVGHIRAFTALASVASAAALLHALVVDPKLWMLFRAITGFCFAGLSMIIESWINERATNANRGRVLSIYRIIDFAAIIAGQLMLTLADPMGFVLFALLSILISVSLVPVALTTSVAPRPLHSAHLNIGKLLRVSPLAAVACLGVGLANGAFWAVGPVYVMQLGYDTGAVSAFMSVALLAGAVAQWPLGTLSDRVDRRKVIIATSVAAALGGAVLVYAGGHSQALLLTGAAMFGFFAMPIFGLSAAHANDHTEPDQFVATNGGLLLMYGIGAVAGPTVAPLLMTWLGSAGLFIFTVGVHSLLALFGLYRMPRRDPLPEGEKEHYVPVPETTTPVLFELDPRAPELESSAETDAEQRNP